MVKGSHHTEASKVKISRAKMLSDTYTYEGVHGAVHRQWGKAEVCDNCGADDRPIQWSNKNHLYRLVREEWQRLCIPCHRKYDVQVCKHGHDLTPENTYIDKRGYRTCKTCQREYTRHYRALKRIDG